MALDKTKLGKFISLILRHKPEVIGISIDSHGWADVSELIDGVAKTNEGFNMDILEDVVATDSKQRYSFNEDKTKIRANQGHSIPVDVELEEAQPPEILFHGTADKYIQSIDKTGINARSRLYVHLSVDMDTAIEVGKRHGNPVIYEVKTGDMFRGGYKFYLSKNGVWLTKEVPASYINKLQ